MNSNPGIQEAASYLMENADVYTIASGIATIQQCYAWIAAESSTADDLATITLGSNFAGVGTYRPMIVIQADTGDTITVKHNTGNIFLYSAADVTLTGNQVLILFYNGSKWMDSAKQSSATTFTLAGDSGTPQTISNGDTLTIVGGTGLSSTAGATDTVTINLDNTAVTPGSYTNADITVDAQGRLTAAASGSATPWRTDSNVVNLVTDTDTVTIGSATAGGKLFIDGDADEVQLQVQANGTQSNYLALFEDSAANAQIAFTGNGGAIFNEEGNDADFRVETDGNANALFVDGGNNNVGIGTNAPDSDTILDVVSTTKASRPFPTMDSTQRDAIASPATASVIYNSTTTQYEYWDGAAWVALSGSSSTILDDVNGFRLTPTTATPVVASNVTNATSIYLTPYLHNLISLYNGSSAWETLASAEITISLSGLTADTNYDVFVYNNAGTVTVDTLTAWTNATTRATALVRQDGRWVKSGATTRRYVGTIRISGVTGELDWIPQPSAAQGSISIWNMQNRVPMPFRVFEPADTWSYGTATWRQANANTNNQMNVVTGLAESQLDILLSAGALPVTNNAAAAIGEDSTTARATENIGLVVSPLQAGNAIKFAKIVPVGYHYYAWLEIGNGGSVTWVGDAGVPDTIQSGFIGSFFC